MFRRLIVQLTLAALVVREDNAPAQGAFPAPLPGHGSQPSPSPPVNGAAPTSPLPFGGAAPIVDACREGFVALRDEAERRGKAIKAAGERRAPPDEACKLITSYSEAELDMMKYVEINTTKCAIPVQIAEQLKSGHKNTEELEKKVCTVAEQMKTQGNMGNPAMKSWRE